MRPLLYVWKWVRAGFIVARYHWPTTAVIAAGAAGFVLSATSAKSQAVYTGTPSVMDGPMTVNGFVTMTNGLSVDGGVRTTELQADRATVGSLDAGTLYAQDARFGTRPRGIFLPGEFARTAGLPLSTLGGWVSILPQGPGGATIFMTVNGALPRDGCQLTEVPAGLNLLNVDYRCDVVANNQVDIQFKALLGLTIPAGTYAVLISGPGQ